MNELAGFDFRGRMERARIAMADRGLDALLLSVGAGLPYLTGYRATALERLTMAVVPREGEPVLVVPELEAPRVVPRPEVFTMRRWSETEDPVDLVAGMLGGVRRAAVGDGTWARFLLGLQSRCPGVAFESAGPLMTQLRLRKEPGEIERLRRAGAAADRVALRLREERFAGRTERELARLVAEMTVEEGHEAAAFTIVAAGPNGASPHHEPGDRVIGAGDAVVVDFGGSVDGYHSDTTRCYHVGPAPAAVQEVYDVVRRAQEAGVAAVAPGVAAEEIDRAARDVIGDAGYGDAFIHRTGHGIGLEVHEEPYLVAGNGLTLATGMAFSVEPGVYLPGEFGIRIEDIVVVGEAGAERLNESRHDLGIVG